MDSLHDLLSLIPWREAFDTATLARAQDYQAQRRVGLDSVGERQVLAHCQGSQDRLYRQNILFMGSERSRVNATCTCPVAYNCKHCAAALLELESRAAPLPAPVARPPEPRDDGPPHPCLALGSHPHTYYDARSRRMLTQPQHRAGLAFRYGERHVHGPERRGGSQGGLPRRQPSVEQGFRDTLHGLGFRPALRQSAALPKDSGEMFELPGEADWQQFVQRDLPRLRQAGWLIDIRPGFRFDLAPVQGWYATLNDAPHGFDLELGVLVEGRRISLLPVLLRLIRRHPELFSPAQLQRHADDDPLRLQLDGAGEGGRPLQVALPFGRLKPVLATLSELYLRDQPEGDALRLSAPDAARLGALDGLALDWQGGERQRDFAKRLRTFQAHPVEAPEGLRASLRPYQVKGLRWMQTLRELGVGGILADDMGLGKTLQTLAHLLSEKQAGRLTQPALVIVPTSLVHNWRDEAARFAPALRVLALHGPQRRKLFPRIDEHDLLLSTYALLPRDADVLAERTFSILALDEAQYIKNPASKAFQAVTRLRAEQRLCLSGTPLENHLGELWALFAFLMPGWLGDAKRFAREYRTPIERHGDTQRLAHLNNRVRPFILRRRKEQVASELPPKTEIVHWVELSEAQRDLYETVRLAMDRKVRDEIGRKGLARSRIVILDALLKLRQVCCDIRLLEPEAARAAKGHAEPAGKLGSLLLLLEDMLAEGRRVLLFSQFTSMLALIAAELRRRGIDYVMLTGATRDRREPVERFQRGEAPLFLISLKAGGVGLNLTAADSVIHYDPWWNPAAENQATDRAYRIGQDKPVFVYKLIARGTVEEKIQALQREKAALAASILEGGQQGDWPLRDEDFDTLLAPLPTR